MKSSVGYLMSVVMISLIKRKSLAFEAEEVTGSAFEDYCNSETFQPKCMKNEVIFVRNATYGRMRIGRCITDAEIKTLRTAHIGCSENVLPLLDRKCFGETECEIRVVEIAKENIKPCPPGVINVYLEASYDCIAIIDHRYSCAVEVVANPVHLVNSSSCGTASQPWIVDAPAGQKLKIGLLMSASSNQARDSCQNRGVIEDQAGKRNSSVCVGGAQRYKELYLSTGNSVKIFFTQPHQSEISGISRQFILRIQAVGCFDIIPPSDGYAKRNGDAIVIGCYASRKTWHLICEDGKWVGVIGNCSQGMTAFGSVEEPGPETRSQKEEHQVLIIVAVSGLTFAICFTIVCFGGVVCMRRKQVKSKSEKDYKTINHRIISTTNQPLDQWIIQGTGNGLLTNDQTLSERQQMPTYSMFVGEG